LKYVSVTFIHWALRISLSKSGSLYPAYAPVRLVGLAVKHAFRYYAIYFSFTRRLVSDQFPAVPLLLELLNVVNIYYLIPHCDKIYINYKIKYIDEIIFNRKSN